MRSDFALSAIRGNRSMWTQLKIKFILKPNGNNIRNQCAESDKTNYNENANKFIRFVSNNNISGYIKTIWKKLFGDNLQYDTTGMTSIHLCKLVLSSYIILSNMFRRFKNIFTATKEDYLFLDGTGGDESVYSDRLALAYTPCSLACLCVCRRVPVRVVNQYSVSSCQVHT